MNTCDRVQSLVSAYLEKEASPAELRFLEEHLPACPHCREQIRGVDHLLQELAHLSRVETAPDFTERVLARTHGLAPAGVESRDPWVFEARRNLTWAVPLAAAAAIVLAVVSLQLARHPGAPQMAAREPVSATPSPASPAASTRPGTPPQVLHYGKGEGESLGMIRDSYALKTYELRAPTEGGTPILTPVAARPDAPVVVTF